METIHPTIITALKWKLGELKLDKAGEQKLATDFHALITGAMPFDLSDPAKPIVDAMKVVIGNGAQRKTVKRPAARSTKPVPDKGARGVVRTGVPAGNLGLALELVRAASGPCSRGYVLAEFKKRGRKLSPKGITNLLVLGVSKGLLRRVRRGLYRARERGISRMWPSRP